MLAPQFLLHFIKPELLALTFGGMCSWRRVAVARVFALVVRCRDMMLLRYILALAKTVTPGGRPRLEPGRPVPPARLVLFSQTILAANRRQWTYTALLGIVAEA